MQRLATVQTDAKFELLNYIGRLKNNTDYEVKIRDFI